MSRGRFRRDFGSRQCFYGAAGSHHRLQLPPLPKPPRAKSYTWKGLGKTRQCPYPKRKQNNGIILGTSASHPAFPTPQGIPLLAGGNIPAPPGPTGACRSRSHQLCLHHPYLKTGNEAQEVFCGTQFKQDHLCWLEVKLFIPGFFGISAQDMVPLGCMEGT